MVFFVWWLFPSYRETFFPLISYESSAPKSNTFSYSTASKSPIRSATARCRRACHTIPVYTWLSMLSPWHYHSLLLSKANEMWWHRLLQQQILQCRLCRAVICYLSTQVTITTSSISSAIQYLIDSFLAKSTRLILSFIVFNEPATVIDFPRNANTTITWNHHHVETRACIRKSGSSTINYPRRTRAYPHELIILMTLFDIVLPRSRQQVLHRCQNKKQL